MLKNGLAPTLATEFVIFEPIMDILSETRMLRDDYFMFFF